METLPVIISSISIHKSPGIPQGLPAYRNLSRGINLIIGPNGAGKTSTTRAIRCLMWANVLKGLEGNMVIDIGSDTWVVRSDGVRIAAQRNGVDATLTGLPALEGADRYTLALHELMIDKGRDMASEIRRQAAGGYDVEAAGRPLGFYNGAQRRSAAPYVNWMQASSEYDQKKREQEGVKSEEARLGPLNLAKQEGEVARDQLSWYDRVIAWLDAKHRHEQAAERFAALPPELAIMNGEEYANITELTKQIETVALAIQKAEEQIQIQEQIIQRLNLPDTGITNTDLTELEARVEKLENGERDLRDQNKNVEAARKSEEAALAQLGAGKDPSGWRGLTPENLSLADDQLWRQHAALSEQQAVQQMADVLRKEVIGQAGPGVERLSAGVVLLSNWLGSEGPRPAATWILWVLVLLGIGTALAVALLGVWGLVGIVFIVAVFFSSLRKPADSNDHWRSEYSKLGLLAPAAWDRAEVVKTAEALLQAIKERTWQDKVQTMLDMTEDELEKLKVKLAAAQLERARLEEKLVLLPEAPTAADLKNYSGIYFFLKEVSGWAAADHEHTEAIGARDSVADSIDAELSRINKITDLYGIPPATDGPTARANFIRLRGLDRTWEDARTQTGHAQSLRLDKIEQKALLETRRTAIYTGLGLQQEAPDSVRDLTDQLKAFDQANQALTEATAVLTDRQGELQNDPLYTEREAELQQLQLEEIHALRRDAAVKAGQLDQTNRELNQIEGKISLLKQGSNLEAALARKNQALDELEGLFQDNLTAMTGQLILEGLKQEMGDANQPAVYRRAKHLFSRITNGRYELIPPSVGSDDGFRARDTVRDWGQSLEELSNATRIQLLLAVRLAFIEGQEQGLRLPLLADELLATTDDGRAEAIIEALAILCEEGRQIFYFTAQKDEIVKWQNYLSSRPRLPIGFWELDGNPSEVNRFTPAASAQPAITFFTSQPQPEGWSHAEYGTLLQVEAFDLLNGSLSGLHIWYLIEDTQFLHEWLKRGIIRWGQLAGFFAIGGTIPGWTTEMTASAYGKIQILERYQQLHRQGRAQRIDRQILESSKAITDRYMDVVVNKLREVDGDPRQLLAALRSRAISGFRTASADDLERFLQENAFIDELEVLAHEEIILRLQAIIPGTGLQLGEAEELLNLVTSGRRSVMSSEEVSPTQAES